MLKLQQLKKKQAEAKPVPTETPASEQPPPDNPQGPGYILKRQNSKELAETRKQKSKENVFTLRRSGGGKKQGKKKQSGAELRVQKDMSEMDPIPGTRINFPDPDNLMMFELYITPTDG